MGKISFLKNVLMHKFIQHFGSRIRRYTGISLSDNYPPRMMISDLEASHKIYEAIQSGIPFMIGRLGGVEQQMIMNCLSLKFGYTQKIEKKNIFTLVNNAGFFFRESDRNKMENMYNALIRFSELCLNSLKACDLLAIWNNYGDNYIINSHLKKQAKVCSLLVLEPWYNPMEPWSMALEGKNVLFIHPLAETILAQSQHWDLLFPGTNILPHFNLKCLKAVQTIAGNSDSRFMDWFEALEWMHSEAQKIDFDIAIIGCGAYGLPLASMLKSDNKQSILMGGATQLFWGIKGKRWCDKPFFQKLFNDYWVFPNEADKPKNFEKIEHGCYW